MTAITDGKPQIVNSDHHLLLLREMMRIRRFEEKSAELYSLNKIRGFLHLYIGEEAVAAGAMQAFTPEDAIVSTYREHGHALARGLSMGSLMAELYGKANGCSKGHGGSMHFFDVTRRFYGGYAIVGGGLPIAVGLALADKLQNLPRVTACFFGDGAVAEGEFHESLNLAALWKLPVLFICENNLYAMGTALARHQAQPNIARKAEGYGMAYATADGMNVRTVEAATKEATEYVRSGGGPFLLELRTYRYRAHSMADPDLYRHKEEIEDWKQRDPIRQFQSFLLDAKILSERDFSDIANTVEKEVDESIAFAESGEWEPIEDLTKAVYTSL